METLLGWRLFWGGDSFRVESLLGWRLFWGGDSFGVETLLGWRLFWGGDSFGVWCLVEWDACGAGVWGLLLGGVCYGLGSLSFVGCLFLPV